MKTLILIGLLTFILIGCSNMEEKINNKAMDQIEKGNYVEASLLLNNAISLNPDYLDGVVNFRNVYPRAIDQANEKIKEYKKVNDYKLEAYAYEDLLKLKNNYYSADPIVHQKLEMSLELPTIEEIYDLKDKTGKLYYLAGNVLENRELNRYEYRERFFLYQRGAELSPKYKDIVSRREDAYNDALVKVMINYSNNLSFNQISNLETQIKSNISNTDKIELIRFANLDKNKFNSLWKNNNNIFLNEANTGIMINLNYISITPESRTKTIDPLSWREERIVQTSNGPIVKSIAHTYFRNQYYKTIGVEVSFNYMMKDLKTGEIIGSGSYKNYATDNFSWSTYSGNIPTGTTNDYYIRRLKSKKELTNEAISDSIRKLAIDISKKI